ncbi:MAG: hypothetical protein AB7S48_06470 [Bacteroidales bacterium]
MYNPYRIIIGATALSLLILLGNPTLAQNQQNLNKVFENEANAKKSAKKNNGKFKNVETLSYYPDTLPSWFFTLPVNGVEYYAMGISDPDMEVSKAKELAIIRAKSNALLFSNAKVQYYRDIYTSAEESGRYTNLRQRFDTYFKISASSMMSNEMFAVVDTHFTRYNEYMVLLKYTPNLTAFSDTFNLTAVGTTLFIEASVDDAFEQQAEYEMMSICQPNQCEQQKAHYLYREKGSRFLSYSAFGGDENDYPVYVYTYASPFWTTARHAFTSYNGLWSIYTRQLLNYLTLNSQQSSVKLKNMGEQYSSELSSLTREIASFTAKLNINGINFDSDTLKLDIQVEELSRLIK